MTMTPNSEEAKPSAEAMAAAKEIREQREAQDACFRPSQYEWEVKAALRLDGHFAQLQAKARLVDELAGELRGVIDDELCSSYIDRFLARYASTTKPTKEAT